MRAILTVLGLFSLVVAASQSFAQERIRKVPPGVYSASYNCGAGYVPVDFYVLDDYMRPYKSPGDYQRVRVVVGGDGIFVGFVLTAGTDTPRITDRVMETIPEAGWDFYERVFDFKGPIEAMVGTVYRDGKYCPLTPRANPNVRSLAEMSYPTLPQAVDHRLHTGGIPENFRQVLLDAAVSEPFTSRLVEAITADADNWKFYTLTKNTFGDFHFFDQPDNAHEAWVWAGYSYLDENKIDLRGWATGQFIDGELKCIKFHDKSRCTTPRPSLAQQLASLGAGKPHLGPMTVDKACYKQQQKQVRTPRTVVTYADKNGIDTDTVYDYSYVSVWVYACEPALHFKFECITQGIVDSLIDTIGGLGASKDQDLTLVKGQESGAPALVDKYNQRIADGTCVRTQ
jgi:hypothetical protein